MKKIFAYAHTHWDREWYQPFETFRSHLLSVLKKILAELDSGNLPLFYLDGQSVIIEDALELAPELSDKIQEHMQNGRLSAGPWYVLPDEMLVCGESLVRNLKLGLDLVRKFGPCHAVGYSPDTFGHSQDLPRILCGFGINSAFIWRGVPALKLGPVFWWQSPDASRVLAYHLSRGYYQTSLIEKSRAGETNGNLDSIVAELKNFVEDKRQWDNSSLHSRTPDALLYPIGGDHTSPPENLGKTLSELNEKMESLDLELTLCQLHDFANLLHKQTRENNVLVASIGKELRDNSASCQYANAYLLPGVLSSRLYLKRQNREAERRLFRFAEPLFSLLHLRALHEYPQSELLYALKLLLKNHPHDSICGCSVDAVHDEMLVRFACMHQALDPLLDKARLSLSGLKENSALAPADPESGMEYLAVFNPHGRDFTGVMPVDYFVLPEKTECESDSVQIVQKEACMQLFAGFGRVPYYKELIKQRAYVWIENLPAFGSKNIRLTELFEGKESKSAAAPSRLKGKKLNNGILEVSVGESGNLTVLFTDGSGDLRNFDLKHVFKDCADCGDTYNFDPIPNDRTITAKLVSVRGGLKGPQISSLRLSYEIAIPVAVSQNKSAGAKLPSFRRQSQMSRTMVETEVILKRGCRILEFETRFVNECSDHRLELTFCTGFPVHTSFAENHFSLIRRYHQTRTGRELKLPVDAGCESPSDRFPCQRFVVVNGQLFLNKGLPEYAVSGDSLCLTLLRSVSMLSRGRLLTRGGGAGPHIKVPGAECKGENLCSYAWAPLDLKGKSKILSDSLAPELIAQAYDLAEAYEQELFYAFSANGEDLVKVPAFEIENSLIRFFGMHIAENRSYLFLRLLNVVSEPVASKITLRFPFLSAHLCRLDGEVAEDVFLYREELGIGTEACFIEMNFSPNELKTVKFCLQKGNELKAASSARSRKRVSKNKVS